MRCPAAIDALKHLAEEYGVCVRPVAAAAHRPGHRADGGHRPALRRHPGRQVPAVREAGRRLRQAQIREGWHRDDEPLPGPNRPTEEQKALIVLRAHFEFDRAEADAPAGGTRSPTWTTPSPR